VHEVEELIGRTAERAALREALAAAQNCAAGIVLLAGEAGVGKSRLLDACLAETGLLVLRGSAQEQATPPYGPIAAALRSYQRTRPGALAECGPLAPYLALLLPELGPALPAANAAVLGEAICRALAAIAQQAPTALILDDLQWADNATLELLPLLAGALANARLVVVGIYRSDEVGRRHPLRKLRNELRRANLLHEIAVNPLDAAEAAALAAQVLGQRLGPVLASLLYERADGIPLYVKELAEALLLGGRLRPGPHGLELSPGSDLPIPGTLRDAVLLRLDTLPEGALRLLHVAAVAGSEFDLALVVGLAGDTASDTGGDMASDGGGLDLLLQRGLLVEIEPRRGAFRHPLLRDAIYGDISWSARRSLHRQLAERLAAGAGSPGDPVQGPLVVAHHWLAAQEPQRARLAYLAAGEQACAIHAYHDAAAAVKQALDLWPNGIDEGQRLDMLDRLGECAQLSGMGADAARAWREVAAGRRQRGDVRAAAFAERKLANAAELQGHWEAALAAHEAAAQSFAVGGLPAECAAEHLAAAAHLRSAGRYRAALDLLEKAGEEALRAERPDLQARILGLSGNVLARMAQVTEGLALVQDGLALALEKNLAGAAAEVYQRLADSLEHAGEYAAARETYLVGFDFCQANAVPSTAQLCVACLSVVLRHTGEWERAMSLCREVLAAGASSAHARAAAAGMLGSLYALRGQARPAEPLLLEAAALARQIELAAMELLSAWGLALVDELNGDYDQAAEHARFVLERWQRMEDVHYAVPALRWVVTFLAAHGTDGEVRACANALAQIAATSGQPEALSALAHALGEVALLDGDPAQAARQFTQALELLDDLPVPYCQALTGLRAGLACAAAGGREAGVQRMAETYRIARQLGARPLATRAAQALEALGEPIGERLGQGAETRLRSGNLTRRQRQILQLVAQGQTNAEIAEALVLSTRTVEMHVANILATLDSRSRADAVRRAAELGLLEKLP
jgi:DNA-binding CsgD family transcriptional regulator